MNPETPGAAPTPSEVLDAVNTLLAHNAELHRSRGSFFLKRLGFGARPALLNIDLANAWTRAGSPYACDGMDEIIPGVQRLPRGREGEGDTDRLHHDGVRDPRGAEL